MAPTLLCTIRSTDATIFAGRARSVTLPTRAGEVQVLPGHADAFIALSPGDVAVETEDGERLAFPVRGGILRMKDDAASLVV